MERKGDMERYGEKLDVLASGLRLDVGLPKRLDREAKWCPGSGLISVAGPAVVVDDRRTAGEGSSANSTLGLSLSVVPTEERSLPTDDRSLLATDDRSLLATLPPTAGLCAPLASDGRRDRAGATILRGDKDRKAAIGLAINPRAGDLCLGLSSASSASHNRVSASDDAIDVSL